LPCVRAALQRLAFAEEERPAPDLRRLAAALATRGPVTQPWLGTQSRQHKQTTESSIRPRKPSSTQPSQNQTQLAGVRDNLESTCDELADKSMQLQRIMAHYSGSNKAVQALADSKVGQPVMIPLTESLYVPAKLANTERVLVDVGTGYYVQVGARFGFWGLGRLLSLACAVADVCFCSTWRLVLACR